MVQYALDDEKKESDLEEALRECRKAARVGYEIAKGNLNATEETTKVVSEKLSDLLKSLDNRYIRSPAIVVDLESQIRDVVNKLELKQKEYARNLEERKGHLDHFNITVFGRTMAGKSTLMEILTWGDGTSIGTGAQRKTTDVREYPWGELKVTDVPGVGAFEGTEDENLAIEAARKADLIIFLITDDAPGYDEARKFAEVRELSRPVIGICNIKVGLGDKNDLKLFLRNPAKNFDQTRIDEILSQFQRFTDQFLPGSKEVNFVVSHLRSQYLAQQDEYSDYSEELSKASRFGDIKSKIVREVEVGGPFHRMRSFLDDSILHMLYVTEELLNVSEQYSSTVRVSRDKEQQIRSWLEGFTKQGVKQFDAQISKLVDELRSEVPQFSEDHYDKDYVEESWKSVFDSIGIESKIKNVGNELKDECQTQLDDFARELQSELSFVADFSVDHHIKMESISDHKNFVKRVSSIITTGLYAGAAFLSSGPLGWTAFAIGVFGWVISLFFESREEKARKAREELSQMLNDRIDEYEANLENATHDWFHQELLSKHVFVPLDDLGKVTDVLFDLADTQRELAWTLNNQQRELGKILINKALGHLNSTYLQEYIVDVARIPFFATMLIVVPNTTFPDDVHANMEELLGTKVIIKTSSKDQFSLLSRVLDNDYERFPDKVSRYIRLLLDFVRIWEPASKPSDQGTMDSRFRGLHSPRTKTFKTLLRNTFRFISGRKKISIDEESRVAYIQLDDSDNATESDIRLAQQLTDLHIMRK